MKMRVVFDKEYNVFPGTYRVRVRELEFDEELKNVLKDIDPVIKLRREDVKLSELREKVFELQENQG